MNALEELLATLTDWEKRPTAWEALTARHLLFRGLHQAVRHGAVGQVADRMEAFVKDHPPPSQRQGEIAHALLTCAQIAGLTGETAASLPALLRTLDPRAQLPDGLACQAASLDEGNWQQFVRDWLYRLTWQPPLGAAWAWDAVTRFWDRPRPVARSESVTVPLLVNGGVTAVLTLEQLSDGGQGVLYADPATMSFVTLDPDFEQALQNAVAWVRAQGLWGEDSGFDVRWKMRRQDGGLLTGLAGGSAGGAFALGLARLLGVT